MLANRSDPVLIMRRKIWLIYCKIKVENSLDFSYKNITEMKIEMKMIISISQLSKLRIWKFNLRAVVGDRLMDTWTISATLNTTFKQHSECGSSTRVRKYKIALERLA